MQTRTDASSSAHGERRAQETEDAAPLSRAMQIHNGFYEARGIVVRAQKEGIACSQFPSWVNNLVVKDPWGEPFRGECADGERVVVTNGGGKKHRYTESSLLSH